MVPAGSFMMGSPPTEKGRFDRRRSAAQGHDRQTVCRAKFELTFDEWDTCVAAGDCPAGISDSGFGRGQQPVINVTWDDARLYVAWLSKTTGKTYRLLTEAEYEYAARGANANGVSLGRRDRQRQRRLHRLRQPVG